jgi:HEPN domain-containing protein
MKEATKRIFEAAYQSLSEANRELMRPEEDIVSMLVCKNAQSAVDKYLRGYLANNDIETSDLTTIQALYQRCLKINPRFEKLNLDEFSCHTPNKESKYCAEVTKVSNCFEVANNLDTFLREERIIN